MCGLMGKGSNGRVGWRCGRIDFENQRFGSRTTEGVKGSRRDIFVSLNAFILNL